MVHWPDYRPSSELLRYSFRKRSREYVSENSLHVTPYFIDPSRSIYERTFWFILFIVSTVVAVITMWTIWQKFQNSPTITYLNINSDNNAVDFPNVYVCFDKSHLNFSELELPSSQVEILESLYGWNGEPLSYESEYADWRGLKQKLFDALPECSDFFSNCEFGSESYDCSELFARKIASPIGVCCEFESRPIEKDQPSWILEFQPNQYPVRIHFNGKFDGFPVKTSYVMTSPSSILFSVIVTTTASGVRFLPKSQRKCVFFEESISHLECESLAVKDALKSKCGCLPWFFAPYQFEECPLSKYDCLYSTMTAMKTRKHSSCYISCNYVSYTIEKIEYAKNTSSNQVGLLSWPEVRYYRVTRFGWLDLLVSFGGIAGCFIGYSIITTFEVVYYFTLRTYCGAVLSVPKTRFNVQPAPIQRKKPVDSSAEKKIKSFKKLLIAKV